MRSFCCGASGFLLSSCLLASSAVALDWVEIFDGRSLDGWAASDMSYWSVRDGAITGSSTSPLESNHYLVWQRGRPADFELSLRFRIRGTQQANSGVQFRSKIQPNGFVEGYQADIARYPEHCGVLYDETAGRGLLARRGQRLYIGETGQRISALFADESDLFKVVRLDDWNEHHIIARDSWVSARLNGSLIWQVVDRDRSRRADEPGVIALQLHSGPPMTVQFKDIRLRDLTPLHADRPNPFFAFCMDTHDARKRDLAEQAALLSELGYAGAGHLWTHSVAERLRTLDAAGLRLFQIYLQVNVSPEATETYDPKLQEILTLLRARDTMVAVLVNGGRPSDTNLDQRAVAVLKEMSDLAKVHGVKLALYPHTGNWLERVEDAVRLVRKAGQPNIGVMFNLCHFLKVEDEKNLNSAIELAGDHLFAVSINGSDSGEEIKAGKGRWIAPLDTGSFDQRAFLKLLRDKGFRGPIGLQCYGIPGDAAVHLAASIRKWSQLHEP